MKIPPIIEVVGKHYIVEHNADHCEDQGCRGQIIFNRHRIILQDEKRTDEQTTWTSFIHELQHAILSATGYTKLNDDEEFIDRTSELWYQIIQQLVECNMEEAMSKRNAANKLRKAKLYKEYKERKKAGEPRGRKPRGKK